MRIKFIAASILSAAICSPMLAHAEFGIYAKGGTLGIGGGFGYGIGDTVTARVGFTTVDVNEDFESDNIEYNGDVTLGGTEAMLDWHPFGGVFRITGGVIFSANDIQVDANLNGIVTIDGVEYNQGDIGDLGGEIEFNSTTPYIGIGWGNVAGTDGQFHFVADIGVQYIGSPNVNLHGSCTAQGIQVTPEGCANLDEFVRRQEEQLSDDVDDYEWWPVISIGFAYRF